ncbi:hypothetical protein LIER_08502 [Lithospermum erythrorhizon]|uniref:Uncharacterized protein n=1 Tax=Lithospermum erythrorhizon TaxID=34254 RepID=A0AAV3PDD8_LITER
MNMIQLMGLGRKGLLWLGDIGTNVAYIWRLEGGDGGSEGDGGELGEEEVVVVEDEVAKVLVKEKGVESKVEFFDGVAEEGGEYGRGEEVEGDGRGG